ncbi:MAG: chromosomal replication initiator protein DnaA [Planctomycetes bacterium]|nr:chromosomal replication initiator protein DnaA [Planctomycetota bacterium]
MSTTELPAPDLSALQARLHDALRASVTRPQYDLWFATLDIAGADEDRLHMTVANAFIRDWLNTYYAEQLRAAVSECLGHEGSWDLRSAPGRKAESVLPVAGAALAVAPAAPEDATTGNRQWFASHSDVVLNEKYTFDAFVQGPNNRLAFAAARAVADAPGKSYNPLFVHGKVGLGKTHLLQAICHQALRSGRALSLLFLSSESFVNQFIAAIEHGDLDRFRHKYRSVDILLVDDIHLLANKDRTQEEFFHTFNHLYNAGKQIVLSSDSPASEIPTLKDRLVSRFRWGLEAELAMPGFETRLAILRRKARDRGCEVPEDVLQLIAEHVDRNIRELEGAITKVIGYSQLIHRPVDLEQAHEALGLRSGGALRPVTGIDRILDVTCRHFGVKAADLLGRRRSQSIALPRQVAMFLARSLTALSLEEIGGHFGGRDHSTVLYAIEKIRSRVEGDKGFAQLMADLESRAQR